MWETWVQSLGWEDVLQKEMATHSSILAWRIPRDRGAWLGYSPWGHKESDTTEQLSTRTSTIEHCDGASLTDDGTSLTAYIPGPKNVIREVPPAASVSPKGNRTLDSSYVHPPIRTPTKITHWGYIHWNQLPHCNPLLATFDRINPIPLNFMEPKYSKQGFLPTYKPLLKPW